MRRKHDYVTRERMRGRVLKMLEKEKRESEKKGNESFS